METYPKSTTELLAQHGHLICAKTGVSYANIFAAGHGDTLRSNWLYFKIRKPLIAIDSGNDGHKRTSNAKVSMDGHTRTSWMKLWDDAHTVMTYDYVANEYRSEIIE